MAADFAPFLEPPCRTDGVLTGRLLLPAVKRFGREFAAVRARVETESYKPPPGRDDPLSRWLSEPTEPEAEEPDDGTRPVLLGEGCKAPTANQLVLAAWLVAHQEAVCDWISRDGQAWYADQRDDLAAPSAAYRDGLPFLPPAGDRAGSDGLRRVSEIHLAAAEWAIGLVTPCALFEGQPLGVCVRDGTEYESGDDGVAYVSDDGP